MDLEGNLSVFEPSSVLQMLNLVQCTGELTLDVGHNSARIFIRRGDVTYAEINQRAIKLGEYLVDKKYITQRDLDNVLIRNRKGKKIGNLLVEDGAIGEDELRDALEEQVKYIIYEVVRWTKGWFQFVSTKKPATGEVFIDIPLENLMLEGFKRMDEEDGEE